MTCKETLRQVLLEFMDSTVSPVEIQSVMLVLSTQLCRSLHSDSDQIQNLQNCYTTPNKNLGGEGASDR
jgi:hypothetical protein